MKNLIAVICFVMIYACSHGQDTIFLDANWDTVQVMGQCSIYQVQEHDGAHNQINTITTFLKNHSKVKEQTILDQNGVIYLHGNQTRWYPNGQIKWDREFRIGKEIGTRLSYWENGNLKRKDVFGGGVLQEGYCWDELGNPIEYTEWETMPSYPGGEEALFMFLGKTMNYPSEARDNDISGIVYLSFTILKNGQINNIMVLSAPDKSCALEAVRVVKLMPNWIPGKQDGEFAEVQFNLPIRFILH